MKKIALLAALLVAAVATTAAPAVGAGGAEPSAACSSTSDAASFDSLASLAASGAAARIGAENGREPSLNETYEALPASAVGKGGKRFGETVPVWIHVISPDGTTANVSQDVIDEQMTVLNLAYSGFYGGARTGFKFELAGVTRTTNADWYNAGAGSLDETTMKKALRRGGLETLNIYTNLAAGYLGYAYLPGLPESRQFLDGVVLRWQSMPGASTAFAGRYDLGMTLVHELGHWFNLEHTFSGGCNAKGDYVEDTPAMLVPTSGCPIGENKDTCEKKPGLDPIHNYMDYSYDKCYNQFTPGQVARAQDSWLYFRGT